MNSTPDLRHAVAQDRLTELRREAHAARLLRAATVSRPVCLTLRLPLLRWTLRLTLSPR